MDSSWNSPGQNTGVSSFSLLQGIFPTQGLNPALPHCRRILYQLSCKRSPTVLGWVSYPFSSRSSQPRNWTGISCIAGEFFINWTITEACIVKAMVFPVSHVWVWELDHKEGWAPKNWSLWNTVVLEKSLESPLDSKEIQPVHPKGNQSWIFIGRTDAEVSLLWPPNAKSRLIRKDPWYWERLKAGEGNDGGWDGWMASPSQWTWLWRAPGVGHGWGSLACCSPRGHKESDTTERLNWTEHTCINIYYTVGSVVSDSHGNTRVNEAVLPSVLVYWCSTSRSHSRCVVELVLETKPLITSVSATPLECCMLIPFFFNDPILDKKERKKKPVIWNIFKWNVWYQSTAAGFPTY